MNSSIDRKSFKKPVSKLYVLDEDFYPGKQHEFQVLHNYKFLPLFFFLRIILSNYSDVWQDDSKMSVLLNTFRPRQVNEEHYNRKMKFWKEIISDYCDYKGSAKVSIAELKEVFKRNGTAPYCLQEVFDDMQREGNLINKDAFMEQPKSLTGWAINSLLVKPLSWGFNQVKARIVSTSQDESTQFVVKSALSAQSKTLLEHIRARHSYNNIISMDDLMNGSDEIEGLSRDGILFVLHYLDTVEHKVFIEENTSESTHHHKLLLKFSQPHEQAKPITDIERSIYNLEQTEKFLLSTIEKKENELNNVLKQVKDSLKDGKKQMAKTFLRKKHMLEADLVKTMSVLENVQTMMSRVHASKNDKDIMNTYKMGSEAIKTAFSNAGINLDKVHDVIEDMQELFDDQAEYEKAISEPIRNGNEIDDSELEKELMDLINSDGGGVKNKVIGEPEKSADKKKEMDLLDLELEERLKRLRTDPFLPEVPTSTQRPDLLHH